jgi:hypothetical protein
LGAFGIGEEGDGGLAEPRGFAEANIAGDLDGRDFFAEIALDVFGDLLGKFVAGVDHCEDDFGDLDVGVDAFADDLDGFGELGEAFEGIEFALQGDDDAIAGCEDVDGEDSETWGGINQDKVVVGFDGGNGVAEDHFFADGIEEDGFGAGEIEGSGDDFEAGDLGGDDSLGDGVLGFFGVVDDGLEDIEEGGFDGVFFDPETGGGVALGVGVDEEDALIFEGKGSGEVDGGGGFADASFLIDDAEDGHRVVIMAGGWFEGWG